MLTGKHPFPLESQTEMLHAIQQRPPLPPSVQNPNVPRDLETIILTLLRKHPRDRYARAEEVIEDLDRFQRGQRLRHASRSPRWDRTRRWWRQVPALIRALSAAVLLLLALVFGLFLHALEKGAGPVRERPGCGGPPGRGAGSVAGQHPRFPSAGGRGPLCPPQRPAHRRPAAVRPGCRSCSGRGARRVRGGTAPLPFHLRKLDAVASGPGPPGGPDRPPAPPESRGPAASG